MSVTFYYLDIKPITLSDKKGVKSFVEGIFRRENRKLVDLKYIFTSDAQVLDLNSKFLNHYYYTDILTFDLSRVFDGIEGEIYVSSERVKENATLEGVSVREEYLRVIFHGALHLCGFSDKTKNEKRRMRQKEDEYLELYKAVNVSRETS